MSVILDTAGASAPRDLRRAIPAWLVACALLAVPLPALAQAGKGDSAQAPAASAGARVVQVPPDAKQERTLRFSRFRTALREGDNIGEIKTGAACGATVRLAMNARTEQAVVAPISRVVREELSRAGYRDPTRAPAKLFEEDTDRKPPDLLLGGMLEEFNASYCSTDSGARTDGKIRVKVRWEVYDPVQRKVVYNVTAEGTYQTAGAEPIREGDFFAMAYRDAMRQMLADQKFYDIVLAPPGPGDGAPALAAGEKPGPLVLKRTALHSNALSKNMTLTRAAVVTVSHSTGTGSGFFVSEGGHVITNSHVVGGNRFVRVTLATGRELVGEVLHRDTGRDVALIKTEGSNFPALAISNEDANIGSEVFAIGSPLGEALSGTVTRGIVSAYRTINGKRYIQSDVPVLPGSSGGPLLDKSGRVVGITTALLGNTRIGFFVPIQEALVSLGITLSGP